MFLNK